MELVVDVASSAAAAKRMSTFPAPPTTPQQTTAPTPQVQNTWTGVFLELLYQLRTRRSWVVAMLIVGTMDMLFNVANLVQMSADDLNYVLVIGPPPRDFWICLCFFTIVGTVLYIPETINTVSALYRWAMFSAPSALRCYHSGMMNSIIHYPMSVLCRLLQVSEQYFTHNRPRHTTHDCNGIMVTDSWYERGKYKCQVDAHERRRMKQTSSGGLMDSASATGSWVTGSKFSSATRSMRYKNERFYHKCHWMMFFNVEQCSHSISLTCTWLAQ